MILIKKKNYQQITYGLSQILKDAQIKIAILRYKKMKDVII